MGALAALAWARCCALLTCVAAEQALRSSTIDVLVGPSSDSAKQVGTVRLAGAETPLSSCPSPLPNL